MVSTRSVRHKFSEGEKVLCYEPDPAKTKVLYNSKVLDIGIKKDENGKNVAHFLIHFQGWNSTWDRFVTEDYILKDTEENRKLQKELAEKAQLTSGGNLYRRGRKRRTLSRTGSDNEKRGGESDSEGETGGGGAHTSFSPGLQAILDSDYALINCSNKLAKLPASPNAVEILELYMKDFTISQIRLMCHKRGHLRPSAGRNAHMTVSEIFLRANVCREIADGLRVYIDFMTELSLLYPQERPQFKEYSTKLYSFKNSNKKEEKSEPRDDVKDDAEMKSSSSPIRETDRRKSLRSHSESSTTPSQYNFHGAAIVATGVSYCCQKIENNVHSKSESGLQCKAENNVSQTKLDGQAKLDGASVDLASFLGHDVVKGGENLMLRPMSQRERDLLKKLVNRKLVPDLFLKQQGSDGAPISACLIYGAVHLARALVKIPEIFPHAEHSESKINTITEYLNGFTRFLEEHPEWFTENHYCENTYSQVHEKKETF